jgi:hypothetical protein
VFTIHGANPESLDLQCPAAVKKIRLSKMAQFGAKEFLNYANINEGTTYPDIFGIAQHVVERAFPIL